MDQDGKEPCPEALHTERLLPVVDLKSTTEKYNLLITITLTG